MKNIYFDKVVQALQAYCGLYSLATGETRGYAGASCGKEKITINRTLKGFNN